MSGNGNANNTFVYGWVLSPNGRGTMDIIQICLTTVFLCTYTTLFLNIKPKQRLLEQILHKSKWAAFTVFCPEVVMAMAGEQWRSTVQSVEDFTQLRKRLEEARSDPEKGTEVRDDALLSRLQTTPWTAQHAFLADMGGLRIQFPDFEAVPVKAYQFFWLVENRHIPYLEVDQQAIWDKDKADIFARGLTLLQLIWFTVQSIARGVQHLDLTTLELSTLAFAFCTVPTFWFWRNKPLDIGEPITLKCEEKTLAEIVKETGQAVGLYTRTPFDFLETEPRINYIDAWFWAIKVSFGLDHKLPRRLPVATFSNIDMIPPRGIRPTDIFFALTFVILYFAIHLAAWVFPFPTAIERHLWRIAAIVMAGLSIVTMLGVWPGCYIGEGRSPPGEKWTIKEAAMQMPRWALRMIFLLVIVTYFVCRTYVIVEGFVSLRALPASAYESVNWWGFVPHF